MPFSWVHTSSGVAGNSGQLLNHCQTVFLSRAPPYTPISNGSGLQPLHTLVSTHCPVILGGGWGWGGVPWLEAEPRPRRRSLPFLLSPSSWVKSWTGSLLIFVSLITNGAEHLFTCVSAICRFSLETCPFRPLGPSLRRLALNLCKSSFILETHVLFHASHRPAAAGT